MENFEKLRKDKIKLLESVLNKDKIQARVNGCAYSDIWIYNEKIKIDNLVIGYIRPKDEFCNSCDIDFYRGNIKLVTLDFEIEKDLNSEKLVCRTNNGTFDLLDMESLDEIEYAEDIDQVDACVILPESIRQKICYTRILMTSDTIRNIDYGSHTKFLAIEEIKGD